MTFPIDETHDPALTSWVETAQGHPDFPIQNLPYAIFATGDLAPRPGVAIGDRILDLRGVAELGLVDAPLVTALQSETLNALLALPAELRRGLRGRLSALLSDRDHEGALRPLLHPVAACSLHLPAAIGDYTDFYVGIHHAMNAQGTGITWERWDAQTPHYKGIFDDKNRLMVIICHNTDLGDGWEREGETEYYFREFSEKKAYPMGINIVFYAMTH